VLREGYEVTLLQDGLDELSKEAPRSAYREQTESQRSLGRWFGETRRGEQRPVAAVQHISNFLEKRKMILPDTVHDKQTW